MALIIETGMFIRKYYNEWRINYTAQISSMGYREDNPIKLATIKDLYFSRAELEADVAAMGYIVNRINSTTSLIMINLDDSEALAKIEKALE